jgi:hypothetical protein
MSEITPAINIAARSKPSVSVVAGRMTSPYCRAGPNSTDVAAATDELGRPNRPNSLGRLPL